MLMCEGCMCTVFITLERAIQEYHRQNRAKRYRAVVQYTLHIAILFKNVLTEVVLLKVYNPPFIYNICYVRKRNISIQIKCNNKSRPVIS